MTHDDMVLQLITKQHDRQFTLTEAAGCLVKAIAGNFKFGFEVMKGFLQVRQMPLHQYEGADYVCEVCRLPRDAEVALFPPSSDGKMQYDVYKTGGAGMLIAVWDHVVALDVPKPTTAECAYLRKIMKMIRASGKTDSIHDLRMTLSKAGTLSAEDYRRKDYARFWDIMHALVNLGIMPNDLVTPLYDGQPTSEQFSAAYDRLSDEPVILPASAWHGQNGVNLERYRKVFARHL